MRMTRDERFSVFTRVSCRGTPRLSALNTDNPDTKSTNAQLIFTNESGFGSLYIGVAMEIECSRFDSNVERTRRQIIEVSIDNSKHAKVGKSAPNNTTRDMKHFCCSLLGGYVIR